MVILGLPAHLDLNWLQLYRPQPCQQDAQLASATLSAPVLREDHQFSNIEEEHNNLCSINDHALTRQHCRPHCHCICYMDYSCLPVLSWHGMALRPAPGRCCRPGHQSIFVGLTQKRFEPPRCRSGNRVIQCAGRYYVITKSTKVPASLEDYHRVCINN